MIGEIRPLHRYKCRLNCADVSADFEVRSIEIIVKARDALSAREAAAWVSGRGVVDVARLEDV